MSAWGNLSNDTGGLSYNLAASLSGNVSTANQSPLGGEQFPVLGQLSQQTSANQSLRQTSQQQPQERQASAAAAAASILLNTLQQNGNSAPANSNGDANNKDLITNGNASKISSINILPPGLESQQQSTQQEQQANSSLEINDNHKEIAEEDKTDMDRYGLNGLLSLLRNGSSDQHSVAMGTDLNLLGLDMTMAGVDTKISKTFASPWLETSRSEVTPLFKKPDSFNVDAKDLANLESMLPSFTDENLFFIFYSKPRDILQDLVTKELNNRSWRFHKDLQVWVTKDNSGEVTATVPGGEQRSYIFFDPTSWEYVTKEFMLYYSSLL